MSDLVLRDRIFDQPLSFAAGCLTWIPLALMILSLVRWMVGGEVDVIFGLVGIFVSVALGYVAINPPAPIYSVFSLAGSLGTVVVFPFLRAAVHRHSLRALDVETLERAHLALRMRPDNIAAEFKIARLLYDMGYPGHALRIAERCIAHAPQAFFVEEQRLLTKWRMTPTPIKAFEPLPCIECGHPNPPGNVHCAACGAAFLLDRVKGKVLPSNLGRRLLAAWIVMIAALAGIPLLVKLGGVVAMVGALVLLSAAVAVLALAFREQGSEAA